MSGLRVLLVDDEPFIRELVEISLGLDPDILAKSCASGREALAEAAAWSPDLVLLDVMMPDMDGPQTLMHLREADATAGIPVVFMTARAQDSDIAQFLTLGAAGVILKPFDPVGLGNQVKAYVRPAPADMRDTRALRGSGGR